VFAWRRDADVLRFNRRSPTCRCSPHHLGDATNSRTVIHIRRSTPCDVSTAFDFSSPCAIAQAIALRSDGTRLPLTQRAAWENV
jgi:hypothetical protein